MILRKFKQDKLWRDKLIEAIEKQGSIIHWRSLNDEEFSHELKRKFMEEAQEVVAASTKEALIEELADIIEVIEALCTLHTFSFDDIIAAKEQKRKERGGFEKRAFITIAEHPAGSFGEQYCLADPAKYPEV